jgi:Ribosomal protein L34e
VICIVYYVVLTYRTAPEEPVSTISNSQITGSNRLEQPLELSILIVFPKYRYNTRSNKVRVIKTPGGKLRYLHIKKKGTPVKCGDCGMKLPGVSVALP